MVTRLLSLSIYGLEAVPIQIEVDIQAKVMEFEIVGMAGTMVKESVKRIESAIQNQGFYFPCKRIIVNLAPAGIKKMGTLFDLPIALGIIGDKYDFQGLENYIIVGELSLNGEVRPIRGALPIAVKARDLGFRTVICPGGNAEEMAVVEELKVLPVSSLFEAVGILSGEGPVQPYRRVKPAGGAQPCPADEAAPDMSDIKGQESAKRALEISAAGGHNALMIGPPGTGKTMLARRIPTILPDMTVNEALETSMVYSVAGMIDPDRPLVMKRPFRTPHHTASDISIIGGGKSPRPGEISLAHNGVLFLDELQLFRSNVLQVLRQPLEEERITISRAEGSVAFPANFMLVSALNPSRRNTDLDRWEAHEMAGLLNKISGPLLDRIDIHVQVSRVPFDRIQSGTGQETSAEIKARVQKARDAQVARFQGLGIHSNSRMSHKLVSRFCAPSSGGQALLRLAMEKFTLSIRVYDKVLKISRTIADLEGSDKIEDWHVSEALQYRVLDRIMNAALSGVSA